MARDPSSRVRVAAVADLHCREDQAGRFRLMVKQVNAEADLLLLCAWCYAYRGEHDEARFAYRQSKDREGSHRLDIAMPKVAQWIEEYRKEHPDLDQPDADEA